ncbi:MAG: hemin-degrading factor [Rhodobacteraceae bacterium]|nr:hemin-degrading factor [Paracoccaceae bacterium]
MTGRALPGAGRLSLSLTESTAPVGARFDPAALDYPALLAAMTPPAGAGADAASGPPPRARDLAARLGVPEAALLEARRGTGETRRLARPDAPEGFGRALAALEPAGDVMALTRNEACVHERHGTYRGLSFHGATGLALGEIDLRLFLGRWAFGYAVAEETRSGPRRSLQFFDAAGGAIHKIYATGATDMAAFESVAAAFADPDAAPAVFAPPAPPAVATPDAEIDAASLRAGWAGMGDIHEFHGLLRDHKASVFQAMKLAGPALAREVPASALRATLEGAAETGQPIMVFASNPGCVQIHTGPVERIKVMGPWVNVLDPRFNLHLREDMIARAWISRKPTDTGEVHSLELFDADGERIAQLFGARKPGQNERADWRALLAKVAGPVGMPEGAPA